MESLLSEQECIRYMGFSAWTDPLSRWVTLTHRVQAKVKLPQNYRLFAHMLAATSQPTYLSFVPAWAQNGVDTSTWEPGQVYEFTTRFRLDPGDYDVFVGFAAGNTRLKLNAATEDLLPVGRIRADAAPVTQLRPTGPLLTAGAESLLGEILALPVVSDDTADHLETCYAQAPQFGHVLEFGVASGATVIRLGITAPWRNVWGFDSFEGLPEDWDRGNDMVVPAGAFTTEKSLPQVPPNVRLVPGWFEETLPGWLNEHPGNIAFLHVDVDVYSAAHFVLETLNDRIIPGTVIVFDDLGMWSSLQKGDPGLYPKWDQHEWRALMEWLSSHQRIVAPISRLSDHVLGVRVLK